MRTTHFGHACVLLETGSARLLVDPGSFSHGFEGLRDLTAVLITHQHPDHLDLDRLSPLLAANPGADLVADGASTTKLGEQGHTATAVHPGDSLGLDGAAINVVGGEHAVIHPDIPVIPNIGYLVDHGAFYHPGDSFHVPEQPVDVLGLPTAAPWLKVSEAVDFFRAVAPRVAVPIHEAVLSVPELHYRMFDSLRPDGSTFTVLPVGTATTV